VRSRRLRNYRLSLAMLEKRLPDSPLVTAFADEISTLPERWLEAVRRSLDSSHGD